VVKSFGKSVITDKLIDTASINGSITMGFWQEEENMFNSIVQVDTLLLFDNDVRVVAQTLQDHGSLECIRKHLALTLIYALDGTSLTHLQPNRQLLRTKPPLAGQQVNSEAVLRPS
jgi:hypothetical protein